MKCLRNNIRAVVFVLIISLSAMSPLCQALDKPVITYGNLSVGKFYSYSESPEASYPDVYPTLWSDGSRLTDEELGSSWPLTPWVGWYCSQACTIDIVLDLGSDYDLDTIRLHSMSRVSYGIKYPSQIVYYIKAQDQLQWTQFGSAVNTPVDTPTHSDMWFESKSDFARARYVKFSLTAKPDAHLFIDEIEVFGNILNSWKHVPDYGCYHGAFPSNQYGYMNIPNYESKIGKQTSMTLWYAAMGKTNFTANLAYMWTRTDLLRSNLDYNGARLLQIGWEADVQTTSADIAAGCYDTYFKQFFEESILYYNRNWNRDPVWLRINSEMNGGWVFESPSNDKWYGGDPLNYRRAWRRLYNIAQQVGAADAHIFVWSPNAYTYNGSDHMPDKYYPGDQYVDWVGMSIYVQGEVPYPSNLITGTAGAGSFDFYGTYSYKPMIVSEGSFVEKTGVNGIEWLNQWFDLPRNYPMVKSLVWFYMDEATYDTINYEPYNSLFRQRVADPFYLRQSIAGRLDLDGDHLVNMHEMYGLSRNWLGVGSNKYGDVDGNNRVDHEDLSKFIAEWLE